jgi:hypothetical protein
MELRLEAGDPGGVSDICEAAETSGEVNGSFAVTKI